MCTEDTVNKHIATCSAQLNRQLFGNETTINRSLLCFFLSATTSHTFTRKSVEEQMFAQAHHRTHTEDISLIPTAIRGVRFVCGEASVDTGLVAA